MATRGSALLTLLLVLLGGSAADAAETAAETSTRLARLHAEGGDKTLKKALPRTRTDPWVLVEELARLGEHAAARATARLVPAHAGHARLPEYAVWREAHPLPAETARAFDAMRALLRTGRLPKGVAAIDALSRADAGVTLVRALSIKVAALERLKRPVADVIEACGDAGRAASKLGWLRSATRYLSHGINLATRNKQHAAAKRLAADALALVPVVKNDHYERGVRATAARAARGLGERSAALEHATRAAELAATPKEQRESLRLLYIIETEVGRELAAFQRLHAIRKLDVELKDPAGVAKTDVQLAHAEAGRGHLAKALARIRGALVYLDSHGAPGERHGAHLNAASIWLLMRDGERALEHIRLAQTAGRAAGLSDPRLLIMTGTVQQMARKHADAVASYEAALEQLEGSNDGSRLALLLHLAGLEATRDRTEEAKAYLAAARAAVRPAARRAEQMRVEATALYIALRRGDLKAAIRAGERARALRVPGLSGGWDALLEARMAGARLASGDHVRAMDSAQAAIDLVVQRSGSLPDQIGAQYRSELSSCFEVGIEAAGLAGAVERLFTFAETARAVAMRTRLGEGEIFLNGLTSELQVEHARLEEGERQAVASYRAALAKADPAQTKEAFATLGKARLDLERHREHLGASRALAAQFLQPTVDGLEAARKSLPADVALVSFAEGFHSVYAVVATRTTQRLVRLGARADLEAVNAAAALEDEVADPQASIAALRRLVAGPLKLPESARTLHIVPSSQLALVPFAAIWPDRELLLLPSTTVSRMLRARPGPSTKHILSVGAGAADVEGALPAVAEEATAIGHRALVGEKATESALRAALAEQPWRSIHIASHALIDPDNPLRSALSLRPSSERDGLFTVSEVLRSTIHADLVTLAACATGRGQVFEQEGTVGFAHAFFIAGARRVLVSLWNVDDAATAALMKRFYREWTASVHPAEALRRAQSWVRSQKRWAHPMYWAGWQLWGAP